MKSVISASIIFIFIITAVIVSAVYVNNVTEEMLQYLYKNEIYVAKNLWDEAESEAEKLDETWRKSRVLMSTFFNHTLIDKVDTSIAKIKNAVQLREKEDFFYERSNIGLILFSFKEQQKINAGNIF